MAWVVPIYRSKSILVCSKKPLDISTRELQSFEWINSLLNIWGNSTAFTQFPLTIRVNFWFCSPRQTFCLPQLLPFLRRSRRGLWIDMSDLLWRLDLEHHPEEAAKPFVHRWLAQFLASTSWHTSRRSPRTLGSRKIAG